MIMEALKIDEPKSPALREMRFGDEGFGLMIADLETKCIHVSNMRTNVFPNRFETITTNNFGEFIVACNRIIDNDKDLYKVINAGLLIHQGHFEGTF